MSNKWIKHIFFVLVATSPVIYMLITWNSIPEMIYLRMQYNFDEGKDALQLTHKNGLWGSVGLLSAVILIVYGLTQNIRLFDPKRADKPGGSVFNKLSAGIVFILTAMNFILLLDSAGKIDNAINLAMPVTGILFAFLGNLMYNIKPNYYVGLRLPWTLHSDENWKKTHRLAGILWFAGGVLFTATSFISPRMWSNTGFFAMIAVMILVPSLYSFILFRKEKAAANN